MSKAIIKSKVALSDDLLLKIKKKLNTDDIEVVSDQSLTGGFIIEHNYKIYDFTIFNKKEKVTSFGIITRFADNILTIKGLPETKSFEIIVDDQGKRAVVMSLGKDARAVSLGSNTFVPGDRVYGTGETLSVPVSKKLLGRVVNPLGDPLDRKGRIEAEKEYPIERIAPGVIERTPVNESLQTGIISIDALIPIGRGQRELIIGDRKTGKTSLAISAILNQKGKNVICVYVPIGQKQSNIAKIIGTLSESEALNYTVVVAATAADDAMISYLAPFSGCAIAEYFLHKGHDVLIVYDDLTKHAWSYRELSLLLGRPSGREAYPGDIFYTHSRLLERACKLSKEYGGGSITALPIIETQAGDVSTYVPTNVISITDGQLFLDADQFNAGKRPAVSVGNSVSRVGSNAQSKAMKQVAGKLRLELSQFRELESFTQFGADVDEATKKKISRGLVLTQLLIQKPGELVSYEEIVCLLWAAINGYFDNVPKDRVLELKNLFFEELAHEYHLLLSLKEKDGVTAEIEKKLKVFVSSFMSEFK